MPRGFTVVEFLVVICLVGVVAAAVLPHLTHSTEEEQLVAATTRVTAAIQYAREAAAASGRPTRVTVDATANTVFLEQLQYATDLMAAGAEVSQTVVDSVRYVPLRLPGSRSKTLALDFAQEPGLRGVDISSSDITAADPLLFDSAGVASKEGTVGLQAGVHSSQVKVGLRLAKDSAIFELVK
jgi:prepilin-type N-terminal cleavage/methylation domain-containing protein